MRKYTRKRAQARTHSQHAHASPNEGAGSHADATAGCGKYNRITHQDRACGVEKGTGPRSSGNIEVTIYAVRPDCSIVGRRSRCLKQPDDRGRRAVAIGGGGLDAPDKTRAQILAPRELVSGS